MKLRDMQFRTFDWNIAPDGDLSRTEGIASFRDLVIRWLVTEPARQPGNLRDEEVEHRRKHLNDDARSTRYHAPEGARLNACVPWDPAWGAGIKRYLGASITPERLAVLKTRVRAGLANLQGISRVDRVEVSSYDDGRIVISWSVTTSLGSLADNTIIAL